MAIIQLVRFRLAAGVDHDQFRALDERFQREVAPQLPGLLRREATRTADGEWVLVLRYLDLDSAHRAGKSDTSDISQSFMKMIDMKTMSASFSEVVSETQEEARAIVEPFYLQALTVNTVITSTAVLEKILAEDFQSINSQGTKPKAALIRQVEHFWGLIPDLQWQPREMLFADNKVVVRSIASGSPRGSFMGLELDGTRSFAIDTTDIHEIVNGQIARVHHLEDWSTAIKQLSAK